IRLLRRPNRLNHQACGRTLVLKRDAFQTRTPYTWTHAESDYTNNPQDWVGLEDACKGIVDDTTAFLDRAYGQIVSPYTERDGAIQRRRRTFVNSFTSSFRGLSVDHFVRHSSTMRGWSREEAEPMPHANEAVRLVAGVAVFHRPHVLRLGVRPWK